MAGLRTPTRWALSSGQRRAIRLVAAGLSAACVVGYLLVGFGYVYEATGDAAGDLLTFGLLAAAMFAIGTALLLLTDWRIAWGLGAVFQVLAIVVYIGVSAQRDPPFEVVGLALKAVQVAILGALLALALLPTADPGAEPGATRAISDGRA